jgi:muramoyltetrapeptide carboxypeptidase LdcA involved in peptidoglycan recycling
MILSKYLDMKTRLSDKNNMSIYPAKLKKGDHVRTVTLSQSLGNITLNHAETVKRKLATLGLTTSFGANSIEVDQHGSNSVQNRVDDLHNAFADSSVQAILVARGGMNSNQILPYLDFDLIAKNPKIIIGYSDITAIINAIYAKTGLITYSGPGFTSLKDIDFENPDFSFTHWNHHLFETGQIEVKAADKILDTSYSTGKSVTTEYDSDGFWVINPGKATGTIIGSNLCTLNLLQGTSFMTSLQDSILFIEDDHESSAGHFDRDLESLTQLPEFAGVKGLIIGVFEKDSQVNRQILTNLIHNKAILKDLPVLANVNFGHSKPMLTFPIGGKARMELGNEVRLFVE